MNDPVIIAGALVTIIASITLSVVTISNARAANRHASDASSKADKIITTTEKIHDDTNSNLSAVTNKLDAALIRIEGLEKLLRKK